MYHYEFFICSFDINSHPFHIIIYPVEHGALIDNHGLEIFENICEFDDSLGDVCDFAFALKNCGVVVGAVFLGGLLKGGLGE